MRQMLNKTNSGQKPKQNETNTPLQEKQNLNNEEETYLFLSKTV